MRSEGASPSLDSMTMSVILLAKSGPTEPFLLGRGFAVILSEEIRQNRDLVVRLIPEP